MHADLTLASTIFLGSPVRLVPCLRISKQEICPRGYLRVRQAGGRPGDPQQAGEQAYFWNGARIFSISPWAFFMPSSAVYFSSRISWNVVTKIFRIFQLSWVLISGEA